MKNKSRNLVNFSAGLCILLCFVSITYSQTKSPGKKSNPKEKTVKKLAKGTFEVKVTPMAEEPNVGDPMIGRLALDKQYTGGLAGSSKGPNNGLTPLACKQAA